MDRNYLFGGLAALAIAGCTPTAEPTPIPTPTVEPTAAVVVEEEQEELTLEPTPVPTFTEEDFLDDWAGFGEEYGLDLDAWENKNRISPEEYQRIRNSVPEEEWGEYIDSYIQAVGLRNQLIKWAIPKFMGEEDGFCTSPRWYFMLDNNGSLSCEMIEEQPEHSSIRDDGEIIFDTRYPEEAKALLYERLDMALEDIEELEPYAEVFLAERIKDVMMGELGEAPEDATIELQEDLIKAIVGVRRSDKSSLTGMLYLDPDKLEERTADDLDLLFEKHPDYWFYIIEAAGLDTDPVMVDASHLLAYDSWEAVFYGAHEFLHHLFMDYAIGGYDDTEGWMQNETAAKVLAWDLTNAYFEEFGFKYRTGYVTGLKGWQATVEQAYAGEAPPIDGPVEAMTALYTHPEVIKLRFCLDSSREFFEEMRRLSSELGMLASLFRCNFDNGAVDLSPEYLLQLLGIDDP